MGRNVHVVVESEEGSEKCRELQKYSEETSAFFLAHPRNYVRGKALAKVGTKLNSTVRPGR